MARYHIGRDGTPKPCIAAPGHCVLGGDHFSAIKDAEKYIEEQAAKEFKESNTFAKIASKKMPVIETPGRSSAGAANAVQDSVTKFPAVMKVIQVPGRRSSGAGRTIQDSLTKNEQLMKALNRREQKDS